MNNNNNYVSTNRKNSNEVNDSSASAAAAAATSGNISSDEIDYKKLCKQLLRENETLRKRIKELEEAEKRREQEVGREKRALQRNVSELEEELKSMNEIRADNMRLKDENAALIRVISKLSKN
ncbi:APG6-like protein [Sarcoptes scabiei]|nr:APG6-like protein [Sarcoptes scabiei]